MIKPVAVAASAGPGLAVGPAGTAAMTVGTAMRDLESG